MDRKNLSYAIETRSCPAKDDQCQQPHQGAIVFRYDEENNNFRVRLCKPHQYGEISDMEPEGLKELLLEGIRHRVFNTNDLKKKLDLSSIFMTKVLETRVTVKEKEIIENLAKSKKMNVSEYLRKQALSLNSFS